MRTFKNKKMPAGVKKCFGLDRGRKVKLVAPKAKKAAKAK